MLSGNILCLVCSRQSSNLESWRFKYVTVFTPKCYCFYSKVLLTLLQSVTDFTPKCYWLYSKVLLTLLQSVTDFTPKCYCFYSKVLLTLLQSVTDFTPKCYWFYFAKLLLDSALSGTVNTHTKLLLDSVTGCYAIFTMYY